MYNIYLLNYLYLQYQKCLTIKAARLQVGWRLTRCVDAISAIVMRESESERLWWTKKRQGGMWTRERERDKWNCALTDGEVLPAYRAYIQTIHAVTADFGRRVGSVIGCSVHSHSRFFPRLYRSLYSSLMVWPYAGGGPAYKSKKKSPNWCFVFVLVNSNMVRPLKRPAISASPISGAR